MKQQDILGRATFRRIAPQRVTKLTPRAIRWLKHIERHGPQSSDYLHELTRNTHRCADTGRRQMQKLRAGGYLRLPQQQRAIERADFNPSIYDLTAKARDKLVDLGIAEVTTRPTGHWWHGYMTSCVTSSIDIAASRGGARYIPAHKTLVDGDTIERLLGVELGYVEWCIRVDGVFGNGTLSHAIGFRMRLYQPNRQEIRIEGLPATKRNCVN